MRLIQLKVKNIKQTDFSLNLYRQINDALIRSKYEKKIFRMW